MKFSLEDKEEEEHNESAKDGNYDAVLEREGVCTVLLRACMLLCVRRDRKSVV